MFRTLRAMSRRRQAIVASWVVLGTLGCLAISLGVAWLTFSDMAGEARQRALLTATILPLLLAPALFLFSSIKLRELAVLNHRLKYLASTDSLTGCLSRAAFTTAVDAWLIDNPSGKRGALLVVDVDHFKAINDRFGHHQGDLALVMIASGLAGALRDVDFLGRMGGEEFAVFLPDVAPDVAHRIAERLCLAIDGLVFQPEGERAPLSVSVGCATFERAPGFVELYRLADQRLYQAKNEGRNRVCIGEFVDPQHVGQAGASGRVLH